jgi:lysozyme
MNIHRLKAQLITHEGIRLHAYRDSLGYLTIGIGRMIDQRQGGGISLDEAHYLLENDIFRARLDLIDIFPDFETWPESKQHALIDMRINLGSGGFRSFKRLIDAARKQDWYGVAREMMDSKWYQQVGIRGVNLVEMVQEVAGG